LLDQFYNSVKTFNNLAGNGNTMKDFIAQNKCLLEEVGEVREGIDNNDPTEILDGIIDTIYVALGMLQKLEQLGCDIQGAIARVCYDNLEKFPIYEEDAQRTIREYNAKNVNASYKYNDRHNRYVVKNEAGKVLKPYYFKPTDLSDYVSEELLDRGIE